MTTTTMVTGVAGGATTAATATNVDRHFSHLAEAVRAFFAETTMDAPHLFVADTTDLFGVYLNALPANGQAGHRCECCRRFMNTWGSLVKIDEHGNSVPIFWPKDPAAVPTYYAPAVAAVRRVVAQARVARPYFGDARRWGTLKNVDRASGHEWFHFAVVPPSRFVTEEPRSKATGLVTRTNESLAAQKMTDFGVLRQSVLDYSTEIVAQATALVSTPGFPNGAKLLERARWFLTLRQRVDGVAQTLRDNILLSATIDAPAGWATPRSGIFGTVLDDLKAGTPVADLKRKFAAKTDSTKFMRAQAAPTAGNLVQAEKLVADLGIATALERRFAGPADLRYVWEPAPAPAPAPDRASSASGSGSGSVFAHLYRKTKSAPQPTANIRDSSVTTVTFARLRRTVLPVAESMQVYVGAGHKNFVGFATAVHADAAPIIRWDRWDRVGEQGPRNPVGAYSYGGSKGSAPTAWGLPVNSWQTVSGITLFPWMWDNEENLPAFPRGMIFVLPAMRDQHAAQLDLFAECLIGDLHSVRSSIEALAQDGKLAECPTLGPDGLPWRAGGISLGLGGVLLRVLAKGGVESDYLVNEWD